MTTPAQIAQANDIFRTTMLGSPRHRVVVTRLVHEHPSRDEILQAVRAFDTFNADNDPHGEHDFGQIEVGGERVFWKISYYDTAWEYGADPYTDQVARMLTVMLAEEY